MAKKNREYDNIIDAMLDEREPDWKDLEMEDAKKSGEEQLDRTHQYVDTDFEDEIAESASRHTPIWGPKSGAGTYEQRIAEKEAAAPRINSVTAYRRMDEYKSDVGDNQSLMDEVTESIEKAYTNNNLAENSAAKKEVSDAQVQKYVKDLLNQGVSPAKVAQKLEKLAELELFNREMATDYLQRNAGLMGLAYLEPNSYMDKNTPTYERKSGSKTAGAPYGPKNPPPIDPENPPDDWEDCGSCGGAHPMDFHGDCRDDYNRWPSRFTTGEEPIDSNAVVAPRPMFGSSNDCVAQKKAFDNAGIKIQARSVKQVKACTDCTYFKRNAGDKTCTLYGLPVVANASELSQIVNQLTPGVPNNRKHAALVQIANGEGKRAQTAVAILSQTNVVKTADAKVANQSKRASYAFADNREASQEFSSEHVAKLHDKGASLEQIYKWATEKFGDVETSFAMRGFVQNLKANAKGRVVVASSDLKFLNSIGIRNAAFEGAAKCASCPSHFASPHRVIEEDRGAQRVASKFVESSSHIAASKQADNETEVTVTAAKVRVLHQAGHSVEKIYTAAARKVGSVAARKAIAGFVEGMKKTPGKLPVNASDRAFLEGKLSFKPEQVRFLNPDRRPVQSVTASVPDDTVSMKYASEVKATDGHSILAEYDLTGAQNMQDIDTSGPKRDDVEIGGHFKADLE